MGPTTRVATQTQNNKGGIMDANRKGEIPQGGHLLEEDGCQNKERLDELESRCKEMPPSYEYIKLVGILSQENKEFKEKFVATIVFQEYVKKFEAIKKKTIERLTQYVEKGHYNLAK